MDFNKACEILGVRENASKDEIERKYTVFLKKHRMSGADADGNAVVSDVDIEQVTMAYNLLMGYEEPKVEEVPTKASPLFKKTGIDEKKARNFWYYHKFHILGGIALLLIVAFSLRSCITAEKPDFNISFVGNIYFMENDAFKENIKKLDPDIKTPGIDGAMISEEADSQQQYAMQMKAMVLFGAADVDLFIVDKENFAKFGNQGAFLSLDDYVEQLGADKEKMKDYVIKPEDASAEGLYGIDISKSKLLKDSKIAGTNFVAAIPVKTKRTDAAIKLIKLLMAE